MPPRCIHVWSRPRRILAGTLLVAAGLGVPMLLAAVVLAVDPPVTPPVPWGAAGPSGTAAALYHACPVPGQRIRHPSS